mmetsp:Transcript_2256/g.4529  ORF Transcript_2256/g.4529 Transcript_2256/m.4529 type:complete len:293 (-) Transcript_2256:180-1058(-)|eukprot:CAMPEP_0118932794 /NCGR_PEP_ID=MMETSP1169-20130426/10625_1 /TAXON_ID=36882 /ORGANISM="Pyramimonas obovata, Strain CCMP722" /LENGTH=292 /DNA_ID=CAMNT_0006875495 /DNA_START=384 /DNA_END=1262 /DNA_ORIENTATION=-
MAETADDKKKQESKSMYEEGDRVLVPEGNLFYEAKILELEKEKGVWKYLVHYQGWNKKWDEWLTAGKLIRDTEEARIIEREKLDAAAQSMKKGGGVKVKGDAQKPPSSHKAKKRKQESVDEDNMAADMQLSISLPASLKKQLITDWENITKEGKLVPLPRKPTVKALLQQYLDEASGEHRKDTIQEIVQGIQAYFDKALANILLYSQERDQCEAALKESPPPSEVYGAEHLLRLFIKLPELLPYKSMEETTVRGLEKRMAEVVSWLQKNESRLFVEEYEAQAVKEEEKADEA